MEFSLSHDVVAPPQHAWEVMTDLDSFQHWMPNFVRVERLTEGPVAVGSQFRETRSMFGKESTEHFEFTRLEKPTRFDLHVDGSKGTTGRGEFVFIHELTPTDGGVRVTMRGSVTGMGIMGKIFGFLFKRMMRKALVKDLEALGDYIERTAP